MIFHPINYARKTLNSARLTSLFTEKELFAVVYVFKNFLAYLLGSKVIVHTDHASLRYLMEKKDHNMGVFIARI